MKKRYERELSLEELAKVPDSEIDYSDIPELDEAFWKNARIVQPRPPKEQVTIRFDADILEWFRRRGKGYQTHMNAVLRAYVDAQK